VPDVNREKLDGKSIRCIHLGVSDESKAYKLYEPVSKKIIISRDVIFEETKGWNWDKKETNKTRELISDNDDEGDDIEIEAELDDHNDTNVNDEVVPDSSEESGNEDSDQNDTPHRIRKNPSYLRDYVTGAESDESDQLQNLVIAMFNTNEDPTTFEEAVKSKLWKEAMDSEIQSIEANNTWKLVTLPHGVKPIGVKWIFKTKYNEEAKIEKHKTTLVAKGYSQKFGVNFSEVFAPVARWDTIKTILSLAAYEKMECVST
jgi:hypothetical protein